MREPRSPLRARSAIRVLRAARVITAGAALGACAVLAPGPGTALSWSQLPGWNEAPLAPAWPALLNSCRKLASSDESWKSICDDARSMPSPTEAAARSFFESRFEPHLQRGAFFRSIGLVTGYYEPLLNGSREPTERYRYPIYRPPEDLVTVDLGALYPELNNKGVRGRLVGRRVVPYFSRGEIESTPTPLAGNEFLWVDDAVDLFFLQIQGSGRVQLPSGAIVRVGYADQNGYPYTAIGRLLVERAGFALEEIDGPTIRAWLRVHPDEAKDVMSANASYVFFAERDSSLPGPLGSLGVPLLPEHAIAVDPRYFALGVPVWLDTTLPDGDRPYHRLVFAQDTGGAIKGPLRADLFFGDGPQAESYAGRMRAGGRLYVLLPLNRAPAK